MTTSHRRFLALSIVLGSVGACGTDEPIVAPPEWRSMPALPEATTNNAVAAISTQGGCTLYSVLGLDASRASSGIHARAFALEGEQWVALPEAPGGGRIAASAVSLRGQLYVLGGYSVVASGAETSHADVDVYDPASSTWSLATPLPTPIDDAVAVAWQDRWIIVVSGWSNTRPIAAVQIFDADTGSWASATSFPGTPVFGHAGALAENQLVVLDGVTSSADGFTLVHQAWKATLDPATPTVIRWESLGTHPGSARYRAAAGALGSTMLWAGGTSVPYNYDGLSYTTNQPTPPLAETLLFDTTSSTFGASVPSPLPTMDHRAMVGCGESLAIVGGMTAGPEVTTDVRELQW